MKQTLESLKEGAHIVESMQSFFRKKIRTAGYHEYSQTQPVRRTIGTIFERNFAPGKPTQNALVIIKS